MKHNWLPALNHNNVLKHTSAVPSRVDDDNDDGPMRETPLTSAAPVVAPVAYPAPAPLALPAYKKA